MKIIKKEKTKKPFFKKIFFILIFLIITIIGFRFCSKKVNANEYYLEWNINQNDTNDYIFFTANTRDSYITITYLDHGTDTYTKTFIGYDANNNRINVYNPETDGILAYVDYNANYFYVFVYSENLERGYIGYSSNYNFDLIDSPTYTGEGSPAFYLSSNFSLDFSQGGLDLLKFNIRISSLVLPVFDTHSISGVRASYLFNACIGNYFTHSDNETQNIIYNNTYSTGYNDGYNDGIEGKTPMQRVWDFIGGMFTSIGAIFSIELFPHIPLGIFILIPLFFGAIGLILWIWRRN